MTQTREHFTRIRTSWEAKRQEALAQLKEVEEVLKALDVLQEKGIMPANEGTQRTNPLHRTIRRMIESDDFLKPFTNTDVRNGLEGKANRMTVRILLNGFVEQDILRVTQQGSRGRPTKYDLLPDASQK